jgi:hypothetical protein
MEQFRDLHPMFLDKMRARVTCLKKFQGRCGTTREFSSYPTG